jgi:hypothetical protein
MVNSLWSALADDTTPSFVEVAPRVHLIRGDSRDLLDFPAHQVLGCMHDTIVRECPTLVVVDAGDPEVAALFVPLTSTFVAPVRHGSDPDRFVRHFSDRGDESPLYNAFWALYTPGRRPIGGLLDRTLFVVANAIDANPPPSDLAAKLVRTRRSPVIGVQVIKIPDFTRAGPAADHLHNTISVRRSV